MLVTHTPELGVTRLTRFILASPAVQGLANPSHAVQEVQEAPEDTAFGSVIGHVT